MKKFQVITFANGVKIEVTEKGYTVISTEKVKTEFDTLGNLIRKVEEERKIKKDNSWIQYFVDITEKERNIVSNWMNIQSASTPFQKEFIKIVKNAISKVNYNYKIATIAPSVNIKGRLLYNEGISPCIGLDDFTWIKKAKEFSKEYESELASISELFIYYAYLIAKGETKIEDICDNPHGEDEYFQKVVTSDKGIVWCGGDNQTYGEYQIMSDTYYPKEDEGANENGIGVVVLKKV